MKAIEVKNLTKVYGNIIAVDNVTFFVEEGEIFSLLGPNGAGKTTTVEIIEGIRNADKGEVKIFGKNLNDEIKEKMGILPQEFQSMERLNVKETLEYFASFYRKSIDIDELIEMVGLKEKEKELYKNLSGGQKRLLGVAMALVNDPSLIFLDEPTTGLDPKARRNIWNVIMEMKEKGKTIFLTTHYMEEAEYLADKVAIMHRGKIVAMDEPYRLIEKYGSGARIIVETVDGKKEFKARDEKEVVRIIGELQEKYEKIEIKRANLEDVFLKLTGEGLG
ncbi:MAG: ABC transporter ATP-binding protein [Thermoplasmata archaeon]|nr:MAG: ABC transporter ATP-binding protein [Thermoplasmata archaeon]MCD6572553.1 ABC transporter ATP-binding protein [Thermoplasmata archaeon]